MFVTQGSEIGHESLYQHRITREPEECMARTGDSARQCKTVYKKCANSAQTVYKQLIEDICKNWYPRLELRSQERDEGGTWDLRNILRKQEIRG
jgi:hypothetical protein